MGDQRAVVVGVWREGGIHGFQVNAELDFDARNSATAASAAPAGRRGSTATTGRRRTCRCRCGDRGATRGRRAGHGRGRGLGTVAPSPRAASRPGGQCAPDRGPRPARRACGRPRRGPPRSRRFAPAGRRGRRRDAPPARERSPPGRAAAPLRAHAQAAPGARLAATTPTWPSCSTTRSPRPLPRTRRSASWRRDLYSVRPVPARSCRRRAGRRRTVARAGLPRGASAPPLPVDHRGDGVLRRLRDGRRRRRAPPSGRRARGRRRSRRAARGRGASRRHRRSSGAPARARRAGRRGRRPPRRRPPLPAVQRILGSPRRTGARVLGAACFLASPSARCASIDCARLISASAPWSEVARARAVFHARRPRSRLGTPLPPFSTPAGRTPSSSCSATAPGRRHQRHPRARPDRVRLLHHHRCSEACGARRRRPSARRNRLADQLAPIQGDDMLLLPAAPRALAASRPAVTVQHASRWRAGADADLHGEVLVGDRRCRRTPAAGPTSRQRGRRWSGRRSSAWSASRRIGVADRHLGATSSPPGPPRVGVPISRGTAIRRVGTYCWRALSRARPSPPTASRRASVHRPSCRSRSATASAERSSSSAAR